MLSILSCECLCHFWNSDTIAGCMADKSIKYAWEGVDWIYNVGKTLHSFSTTDIKFILYSSWQNRYYLPYLSILQCYSATELTAATA